jgi:nucleoside-diphosphate-sugar epimerase
VVHLAFIIPRMSLTRLESEAVPELAYSVNVGGTRNLLDAMRARPEPPRLVFASSMHVYGMTQHLPPPRTAADPVAPAEHYARHKVECEGMVRASGLRWTILRFAATFPLALQLDPGMFDVPLDNRMEFAHTRDVGLAVARAVESDAVWGKTLLIGGGKTCQYLFGEMAAQLLESMGVGMLPEGAFSTAPFGTDWLDTAEGEALLHYQRHDLGDYARDMAALLGPRRQLIRLFRPFVRAWLLRRSPYYRRAQPRHWAAHAAWLRWLFGSMAGEGRG